DEAVMEEDAALDTSRARSDVKSRREAQAPVLQVQEQPAPRAGPSKGGPLMWKEREKAAATPRAAPPPPAPAPVARSATPPAPAARSFAPPPAPVAPMAARPSKSAEAPAAPRPAPATTAAAPAGAPARHKSEPRPETLAQRADRLFSERRWIEAAVAYRDLLRQDPHNAEAPRWRQRLAAAEAQQAGSTTNR